MITISRIVCPVDFSPPSRRALDYAIGLARWYKASLTALHVSPLDVPVGEITPWMAAPTLQSTGIGKEALQGMLDTFVRTETGRQAIETAVVEGAIAEEIVTQARVRKADLLVLGTHGRSGFKRLVLGSVAEKVLRTAPCPVMTVPPGLPDAVPLSAGLFKAILCPTDFSEASGTALRWALAIAQEADAELFVIHIFEHAAAVHEQAFPTKTLAAYRDAYEQWAADRLKEEVPAAAREWCRVHEVTGHGSAHREIVRIASERGGDLIVMGVGKTRDLVDRMLGSTTQQVVRTGTCPVLTVLET